MTAATWAGWRAAEEKLARGGEVDAAAKDLPERQAWILRATVALENGDRAALESLIEAAPSAELRAVAEVALSEPGEINPTRLRARLKLKGVPNAPLPRLDLVRLACVAHNREKPTRPQSLAKAAYARQVLDGALMVLSPSFKPYTVDEPMRAHSPRMASFWAAGITQHLTDRVREYVRDHMSTIAPLSAERWPDLDERVTVSRGRASAPQTSLADFLRDPIASPWSAVCSSQLRVLATRGGKAQRLETLGKLLDAIAALVAGGAPHAAIAAVDAAANLVDASPEVRQRRILMNQLALLDMRLCWSSSDLSPSMLEPLWAGVQHLPPAERAHCAWSLLRRRDAPELPREVRAEILAFAARSDADWERELLPALLKVGKNVDMRAFQSALRGADPERSELVLGHMHAAQGSFAEACRLAARHFERGANDEGARMAVAALQRAHGAPPRGRREERLQSRAMLELTRAAAASSTPPGAELLVAVLTVSNSMPPDANQKELVKVLIPTVQARLALPCEADDADLLMRLQLMTIVGLPADAQTAFLDFGRRLRRASPDEGIPAALRICAGLCPDGETVAGYDLDDEFPAPPGLAAEFTDPRPAWLRMLTSWLDRHDTDAVAGHALALARANPADAVSLTLWFEEVSELEESDAWFELIDMSAPGPDGFIDWVRDLGIDVDNIPFP